ADSALDTPTLRAGDATLFYSPFVHDKAAQTARAKSPTKKVGLFMSNRRTFLQSFFGAGAALFSAPHLFGQSRTADVKAGAHTQQHASAAPAAVVTPDIPNLPFTMDNGVKVFKLVAEVVEQELVPGRKMKVWGYNGSSPGPTIQVTNGDRLRI